MKKYKVRQKYLPNGNVIVSGVLDAASEDKEVDELDMGNYDLYIDLFESKSDATQCRLDALNA